MGDSDYPYLSSNIKHLRQVYGDSQLVLANALGLTIPAISNYERGERIPKPEIIAKIAKRYRITVDDLFYHDFSNMKKLAERPFYNLSLNSKAMEVLFPLITTPCSLENENFKLAYDLHAKYLALVRDEVPLPESIEEDIPRCLELYKKSCEEGIVEGAANRLSIVMMMGVLSNIATSYLLENLDFFRKKGCTMKDFFQSGYLPTLDDPPDEDIDALEVLKREFLNDYEAQILIDIHYLKHSPKYVDLGDYYFALRYMFDLCSNSQSSEQNASIGAELMSVYSVMRNPFARNMKNFGNL